MSLFDRLAFDGAGWRRSFCGDVGWFGVVGALALLSGVLGDRIFRTQPLGLRYRTTSQRILMEQPPEAAIIGIGIEEVGVLLADPNVVVLDARPGVFFEMGHLPGARNLSREQFEKDFAAFEVSSTLKRKTLLVYCSDVSCEDGAIVARTLQQRGLGPLRLFQGGFVEWEAAGKPVETSQ